VAVRERWAASHPELAARKARARRKAEARRQEGGASFDIVNNKGKGQSDAGAGGAGGAGGSHGDGGGAYKKCG
jgi:hypothetical protein